MKIGIIGKGTVGKAVYEGLEYLGHNMSFFDPAYEGSKLEDVLDAEVVFISVPTPMGRDGRNHLGIVKSVIENLRLHINPLKTHIVIRSTVLPGTSSELGCYFMPEFLTEKVL